MSRRVKASPFTQRTDQWSRRFVPLGWALTLLLLSFLPLPLEDIGPIRPNLLLIPVFYWAIYRPDLFGLGSAFFLGLVCDLMGGTALGVTSLSFVIAFISTGGQRRFFHGKSFAVSWWGFSIVAAGALSIQWFFSSLLHSSLLPLSPVFFSYLVLLAFYPIIGWVCARISTTVLKDI